jgi:hypothetical protein
LGRGLAAGRGCDVRLCGNSKCLSCAEGNDPADRIVRGYADCHAISWNNFDSKAAHPATQLRQHFMAGVALHAVQTARVNRNYGSLHVYQIVFAQSGVSF